MKHINVTIYCDEIKNAKLGRAPFEEIEKWDYIGICIVPTKNISNLAKKLNDLRCDSGNCYTNCIKSCKYHKDNNVKVHYQKYDNTNNFKIAERWCDVILENNNKNFSQFYMHIMGINKNKLDKSYFKETEEKTNINENIYTRFFRTAILFSLKKFFSNYDEIVIDNIFHDSGDMQYHDYFSQQIFNHIYYNEEKITSNCKKIGFIETNKYNCLENNNTLLQFIDLFLGATFNMLHSSSEQQNKFKISQKLSPVIDRCINKPNNINSRYFNIYSMSFFPKNEIKSNATNFEKEILKYNNFYTNREMKLKMKGQMSLFDLI